MFTREVRISVFFLYHIINLLFELSLVILLIINNNLILENVLVPPLLLYTINI